MTSKVNPMEHTEEEQVQVGPECRICLQGQLTKQNKLMTPCSCKGSIQYIHEKCVKCWIALSLDKQQKQSTCWRQPPTTGTIVCELCKDPIEYKSKHCTSFKQKKEICQWIEKEPFMFGFMLVLMVGGIGVFVYSICELVNARKEDMVLKGIFLSMSVVMGIYTVASASMFIKKVFLTKQNMVLWVKDKRKEEGSTDIGHFSKNTSLIMPNQGSRATGISNPSQATIQNLRQNMVYSHSFEFQ